MKQEESPPRPAPAEPSPYHVLLSGLQTRLRAEAPSTFAGTARASDGGIDVYTTSPDTVVSSVADELRAATGGQVPVHIVAGVNNSLATLEDVRDQIRAQWDGLLARGIKITEFGVDPKTNRVRIGIKDLTPETAAYLAAQFGADRIRVVEGGEWAPVRSPTF